MDESVYIKKKRNDVAKRLRDVNHHNVIKVLKVELVEDCCHITMQNCLYNLDGYFERNARIYNTKERLDILKQIGKGLKYLHNLKPQIIHQNLKPQNVLLTEKSSKITVQLSDFAIENVIHAISCTNDDKSLYCMPPEVLKAKNNRQECKVTTAVDIYAYGCLIHSVLSKNASSNYHPFGDLNDKTAFKKNVIEGVRKNCLHKKLNNDPTESTQNEKSDILILADLAIQDSIDIRFKRRPTIAMLLKHPMFWTARDKQLFFDRIKDDYNVSIGKRKQFLTDFDNMFDRCFTNAVEFKVIENIYEKVTKKDAAKLTNIKLVDFIRHACTHFKKYQEECKEYEVLQTDRAAFIDYVIASYPYLVFDLFKCYRRHVIKYVLDHGEHVGYYYHKYFKHLCDKLRNKTWKTVLEDKDNDMTIDDIQGLYLEELKPFIQIELVMKLYLRSPEQEVRKLLEDILTKNLRDMGAKYRDFVKFKIGDNYESLQINCEDLADDSCRYELGAEQLSVGQELKESECLNHNPIYTFDTRSIEAPNGNTNWRLAYKSDGITRFQFFNGNNDELRTILEENEYITLHRSSREYENVSCQYRLRTDNFDDLPKEIDIKESECLIHNPTFDKKSIKEASYNGYYWWLEYKNQNIKKMYSFFMGNDDELKSILSNQANSDFILYRSSKKFENIGQANSSAWELVSSKRISKDILSAHHQELKPYVAIELVIKFRSQCRNSISKEDHKLCRTILEYHISKMDGQYYDCIKREVGDRTISGIKKPKSKSFYHKISNYKLQDFQKELNMKEIELSHKPSSYFDVREAMDAHTEDYYWWLEYEKDNRRVMHSFIMDGLPPDKDAQTFILHHSKNMFDGCHGIASIYRKEKPRETEKYI